MGDVKHAFILSMYALMKVDSKALNKAYNWAMYQATSLGGDSDTNAAIVGGIVGAYVGIDNIDSAKVCNLLECTLTPTHSAPRSQHRPKFIQPALGCIDEMI